MLFESVEELDRMGNFERIFPLKHNIDQYKGLFEFNRYNNNVLWKYLKSDADFIDKLYAWWKIFTKLWSRINNLFHVM